MIAACTRPSAPRGHRCGGRRATAPLPRGRSTARRQERAQRQGRPSRPGAVPVGLSGGEAAARPPRSFPSRPGQSSTKSPWPTPGSREGPDSSVMPEILARQPCPASRSRLGTPAPRAARRRSSPGGSPHRRRRGRRRRARPCPQHLGDVGDRTPSGHGRPTHQGDRAESRSPRRRRPGSDARTVLGGRLAPRTRSSTPSSGTRAAGCGRGRRTRPGWAPRPPGAPARPALLAAFEHCHRQPAAERLLSRPAALPARHRRRGVRHPEVVGRAAPVSLLRTLPPGERVATASAPSGPWRVLDAAEPAIETHAPHALLVAGQAEPDGLGVTGLCLAANSGSAIWPRTTPTRSQ